MNSTSTEDQDRLRRLEDTVTRLLVCQPENAVAAVERAARLLAEVNVFWRRVRDIPQLLRDQVAKEEGQPVPSSILLELADLFDEYIAETVGKQ